MRLSLSNGIFATRTIEENIEAVKQLGFDNLEFNMKCIEENDDDSVKSVKELIGASGLKCLTVHAAILHVQKKNEIEKAKYYSRVSLDFAHELDAGILVIHSNVSRKLPEKLRRVFLGEIFSELPSCARRLGVRLALENLSCSSTGFGKDVVELDEVLGIVDCDGTMGITFDFSHATAAGQTAHLLEKYSDRICNIHLSSRAHKPFEEETDNLRLLLKKLREHSYDGPLTLELTQKCSAEEVLRTMKVIEQTIAVV